MFCKKQSVNKIHYLLHTVFLPLAEGNQSCPGQQEVERMTPCKCSLSLRTNYVNVVFKNTYRGTAFVTKS